MRPDLDIRTLVVAATFVALVPAAIGALWQTRRFILRAGPSGI
jgi:hypothetical protein